jgi:hypothetical protein
VRTLAVVVVLVAVVVTGADLVAETRVILSR